MAKVIGKNVATGAGAGGDDRELEHIRSLANLPSENPNPIVRVTGGDATVLYANEAARELPGLIEGADALTATLAKAVAAAFKAAATREAEFVSGDRIFVFGLTPVAGESYVNLYGRDVTDERRANAEARSLAKFPSENPNPILRVAGDDGAVLYANEAARTLAGLIDDADDLTGTLVSAVSKTFRSAEAGTAEFVSGDRIYVFATTPVAGESYVNLYGRDVTDVRRANEEARSLAKFPSENPNPILRVAGDDGSVLYANEAARELAGLLGGDDALTETLAEAVAEAHRAGARRGPASYRPGPVPSRP